MTRELTRVGNASSLHGSGRAARRVVEESREAIAARVGARPAEVIFTSGGTESDNLAVKGGYWSRVRRGPGRRRHLHHRASGRAGLGRLAGPGRGGQGRVGPGRSSRPDRSGPAGRSRDRDDRRGVGDVGQQRGRHGAAGDRDRRAWPATAARSRTATRCRRWVTCRSTSPQRSRPADLHRAQARRPVRDRCAARPPGDRPHRRPARRRSGARRPVRHPRRRRGRRLRRRGRRGGATGRRSRRRGCRRFASSWWPRSGRLCPASGYRAASTRPRVFRGWSISASPAARPMRS